MIGNMNKKYKYCRALKWSKEPTIPFCSVGKFFLEEIADSSES